MPGSGTKPSSALAEQPRPGLGPRDCPGPAQSEGFKRRERGRQGEQKTKDAVRAKPGTGQALSSPIPPGAPEGSTFTSSSALKPSQGIPSPLPPKLRPWCWDPAGPTALGEVCGVLRSDLGSPISQTAHMESREELGVLLGSSIQAALCPQPPWLCRVPPGQHPGTPTPVSPHPHGVQGALSPFPSPAVSPSSSAAAALLIIIFNCPPGNPRK